jgi:hypothetical protein
MTQEQTTGLTTHFRSYPDGEPGLLERVWVGWRVMALAFQVRAGRRKLQNATVWEAMSWWWWETHIAIPEEERMAKELERLFAEEERNDSIIFTTSGVGINPGMLIRSNGSVGLGTTALSARLHIGLLTGPSAGAWEVEGIKIETETHPNFLRTFLIQALFGVKWKPSTQSPYVKSSPTTKSSLSLYARLSAL